MDTDTFKVEVKGKVNTPATFTLAGLKKQFAEVEVVAMNQCSGNGRAFSQPRIAGGQMGHGCMGKP